MPADTFTFDGQHAFLTYPQSGDVSRERLRDFLLSTGDVDRFFIARELHGDGEPHLHAYVHWTRRRRFVGSACFDVDGHHPNVQKPRSAKAVVAYCAKDDATPLANFTPEECVENSGWRGLLVDCPDARTFLERVEQQYPRDLCLSLGRLLEFCEWRFGRDRVGYSGRRRDEFLEPPELKSWVSLTLEVISHGSCRGGPSPLPPRWNIQLMPILAVLLS